MDMVDSANMVQHIVVKGVDESFGEGYRWLTSFVEGLKTLLVVASVDMEYEYCEDNSVEGFEKAAASFIPLVKLIG